jgi:hypothetical protein
MSAKCISEFQIDVKEGNKAIVMDLIHHLDLTHHLADLTNYLHAAIASRKTDNKAGLRRLPNQRP